MKFGVIIFPGSNCDYDCYHAVTKVLGHQAEFLWHKDRDLKGSECLILPGGFSYGDYLRSGAMASCSPIMDSVREFAAKGGLVIGICNGFQILQETGLLPGAMVRNRTLKFICRDVFVRVERTDTPFTARCHQGQVLRIPIAHMDGNFFTDRRGLERMREQVLFRYSDPNGNLTDEFNPNGAVDCIAGMVSSKGNVCGMMPHPERSSEQLLGCRDGQKIFESIVSWVQGK